MIVRVNSKYGAEVHADVHISRQIWEATGLGGQIAARTLPLEVTEVNLHLHKILFFLLPPSSPLP